MGRRPRVSQASTKIVPVRLTADELRRYRRSAKALRLPTSEWVRQACEYVMHANPRDKLLMHTCTRDLRRAAIAYARAYEGIA